MEGHLSDSKSREKFTHSHFRLCCLHFFFSYDFTTIEGGPEAKSGWRLGTSHRRWNFPGFDGVDNDDVFAIASAVVFYVAGHKSENIMKLVRAGGGTMKRLRNCRQSISKGIYEAVFDFCN